MVRSGYCSLDVSSGMPRKPKWEDADLLLRIHELASRPETQKAFDWFHMNQLGKESRSEAEIASDAPEYDYLFRFVAHYEILGVLAKAGVLNEELIQEVWSTWDPWIFFRRTIERLRRTAGPAFAENFEWLALRDKKRRSTRIPPPASRRRRNSG
jgi:hypothetical protein